MSDNLPARPEWTIGGPDADGMWSGPTFAAPSAQVNVHTGWSAETGPMLWMDTALNGDAPLSGTGATEIASGLLRGVLVVGGAR